MSAIRTLAAAIRPAILSGSIAALAALSAQPARAQTYTSPSSGFFTNPLVWNLGAGPIPASDAALALTFQTYGTSAVTAPNDLNLTLETLNLHTYDSSLLTLSSALGGGYAFTGGAGAINLFGSGASTTISAGVVLAQGLTSLTFDGAGPSGLGFGGVISSNTSSGAPLVIATDGGNGLTGTVSLIVANTFSGSVVLTSGALALGNARALGDRANTLTINGGILRGSTGAGVSVANNITLNSTLLYASTTPALNPTILTGVLSGAGGVTNAANGTATSLGLTGINTYSGATTVRGLDFALAANDGAGIITINGAVGSILNSSAINIGEGGEFRLNYNLGNAAANTRVATGTAITSTGGFLEVIGNAGVIKQGLGTVNAGGLTTILAATNGAITPAAGAATEVTIANLIRSPGGTVTFAGPNLGGAAVTAGLGAAQGNVILTQINTAAPGAALIGGGGGVNTPTISILPWALGDAANTVTNFSAGTGFVTYETNGVRLLNATTEYNTTNTFTGLADIFQNMRVTGAVTSPAAPTTVNSVFFAATAQTIGNASALTITSGALASNVAVAAISAPVKFGAAGAGEGIVSVVDVLAATRVLTLSGTVTAGSLVKGGHGALVLSGSGNAIAGGITVNGGQISVGAVSQLGGATGLTFNGQSYNASRAGLTFTHASGTETLAAPVVVNGGMAGFAVTNAAATLALDSSISGTGGVRYDGAGIKVPGGTNTYTGGTYLGAGTLQLSSDAKLGDATNPTANFLGLAGGTLQLTGPWTSARAITVDTGATLDTQANNATLSGPITGGGQLIKLGSGTLAITGADSAYAGILVLGNAVTQGGTLALSGVGALNSASVRFGAGFAGVAGMHVLDLSAATAASGTPWRSFTDVTTNGLTQPHSVQLGASAVAPVDLRLGAGTFGQGTTSGTGIITGFGKLVKVGTGTLTLANGNITTNSTFTGGIEIWGGTLAFSADGQLGNSANGITIQGGILNNTATLATSRGITLGATQQPIISGNAVVQTLVNRINTNTSISLALNGGISGAGGFSKTGAGTLTLGAGSNAYAGDTQLSAGTLAFTDDAQLGAASSRLRFNGGTLQLAAAPVSATDYALPRTAMFTSDSLVDVPNANANLNLSGSLRGLSTTLTKTGAGRLTISGNNSSFIANLNIGNGSAATGNVTLAGTGQLRRTIITLAANSGATLDMSGLTRDFSSLNAAAGTTVALGASGKLTIGLDNGAITLAGNITGGATASFTKIGSGALSITSDTNTFAGGFHLLSGTGTTTLSGNGTIPLQSAFTLGAWGNTTGRGPVLLLDNTGTNLGTRISDSQTITSNAGEVRLATNASSATSETIDSLAGAGMSTVTFTAGGTLNLSNASTGLTRVNRGTFLIRAPSFGGSAASTTIANLLLGNSASLDLVGGNGATNTTTVSILPYAIAGFSATSSGSGFLTYGANGLRGLNAPEYQTDFLAATSLENVSVSPVALTTLTIAGADKTVNALRLTGSFATRIESSTTEILTLGSGLLLTVNNNNLYAVNAEGTAGQALGIQTAELQTGSGNTRELVVHTSTSAPVAIGARVTTSGGITKTGSSDLYLTNAGNAYSGPTTVNAGKLFVDQLSALGASTQLQLGGGFFAYRGGSATLTQTVLAAGGSATSPGGAAAFDVVSGTTLALGPGVVSGFGGVLKEGTGVLQLQGANTNSGATQIAAGAVAIDSAAALGTNGTVVFTNSTIGSNSGGATLRFDAPMTLTQDFLTNGAGSNVGFGFDTNGNNVTLSGAILDARSTSIRGLYKFGAGELNLTATEMYTGATQIFGGTLRLSGADGSIVNSTGTGGFLSSRTVFAAPGTSLVLDNAAANNNNRLPDVWDTPFGTGNGNSGSLGVFGAEFKIIGHAGGTSERINQMEVDFGTITLQGGGTVLTSGKVNRVGSYAGGLIRGTNLGGTPGASSANWFVTDLGSGGAQLKGAGGAEGTPFVNVFTGFIGDVSAAGNGTDFVTYAADVGFRTLTASEYAGAIPAGNLDPNRAPNVALTGAATVNQTAAITALKLGAGASVSGGGTLLLGQSTVLATGNAAIDVSSLSTRVSGGNDSYIFHTPAAGTTLAVSSALSGGASLALLKYGAGTLELSGAQTGAGFIQVAQGTLRLSGAAASLNPLGDGINVLPGATFDLGGSDRIIAGLDGFSLSGAGLGQVNAGTVALGANRLTLYANSSPAFSGNLTGSGGLTKTLNSAGTSTFTQPLSYTGSTLIRGGTLRLAGAGTLASASVELRGGTLQFDNGDDLAAAGGYIANRIGTTTPVTLAGGTITFLENVNTPASHELGPMTLAGNGTINITQTSGMAPSTLTVGNLIRTAGGGSLRIAATNLGLAQSPTGNARIFATQINGAAPASALVGGGGAVGTTTQSILPWALSGTANSFLTYGSDGLRPLATSEYNSSLTAAGTTENVRTTGTQTLVAPATVNSLLVTGGNVAGAFDLTLTSGALATTAGGITIGGNTNALLTGAGNTRELFIQNLTGTLAINYNITTSGGVVTSVNDLTLGGTNPFGGGLSLQGNSVRFSTDANLGAAGGAVRFASHFGALVYTGSAPLVFNRPVETSAFGHFSTGAGNQRWQIDGAISGAGGIGFINSGATSAVFEINVANTFTGPTNWLFGHLYINGDSAFGNGGELLMGGGASQSIVLRNHWSTGRLVHATTASAIQTNGYDATWSGQYIGSGALTKNGAGALILTEAMPYSGALTVNAGEVRMKDRGSIAANANARTVNAGAALTLDDTGAHSSDRLNDSTAGTILTGGEFKILGSNSATTEEVLFGLNANAASASTVTVAAGSGQAAILRVAGTLAVNAGASLWRGTNLGVNAPGAANSATVILTETNPIQQSGLAGVTFLTGGAAPAGNPSVSVIKGGFGDTTATGLGTQLVTYDFDKGVRLLNPATEFTTTLVNGSVVTDNVKADGTTHPLANATTVNALSLSNAASVTGAGTVTLTAGNLLVTGAGNTIANPITAGANALAVGGPGNVVLSGAISGSGGLIKMGAGTLTLSVANSYTGTTVLAAGTVAVGSATAFNATAVQFQGGAIQNSTAGPLTLTNNLTLNGPMFVSGAQNLTFSGTVSLANATREINVTNTGTTTLSGVISSSQTLINYGLTKTGPGLLVLSNTNAYDGETTVNGGELRISGSISASTLTTVQTGTLSGTGTVGNISVLAGATLHGGDSTAATGALTSAGSISLADNSIIELTLGAGATHSSLARTGGTWSFDSNQAFAFAFLGGGVATYDNVITGLLGSEAGLASVGTWQITDAGITGTFSYDNAGGVDLVIAAVPEPGALGLLASVLPAMLLRCRRRARGVACAL